MAKRRPRRDASPRATNAGNAAPERAPISWRGTEVTPAALRDIWRQADRALKDRTKRIEDTRAFRRKDRKTLVRVDPGWARLNPEAAALAQLTLPQRVTLERDLIARVGSSNTVYTREALGFNEGDVEDAELAASYLNEWKLRCVPSKAFAGKAIEDSEFGRVTLPCDLDLLSSAPDYFEYIADGDYERLEPDEKTRYARDEDDARGRRVRREEDGARAVRARYRPRPLTDDEERLEPDEKNAARDARAEEARRKHEDDVTQYILRKNLDASATRLIPALDCRPILRRGTRTERYEVVGLVERVLYDPWELLEAHYRWDNRVDRLLTPRAAEDGGGASRGGDVGHGGQLYLYTLYVDIDDDDGRCRPMIFSCVGGAGTWYAGSDGADDPDAVACIDLYEEYKIEGPNHRLWSYHFGLHTEDDDPNHYGQPYLWALLDHLKAMEGMLGATRSTVALTSYTGHVFEPNADLPDEATLESDASLRVPEVPPPGAIVPAAGKVMPFQQARIGADAWRLAEMDRVALAEVTAIDSVPGGSGPSGHALLVAQTLGTIAKRQARECVLAADVACAEAHLRILAGIHDKWEIKWPIRTTQERPVKGQPRSAAAPARFDPDWVRDGQFNVAAVWPNEANLAMVDLLATLKERGLSNFDAVQSALGEQDASTERRKVLKDRYFDHPVVQTSSVLKIAQAIGDQEVVRMLTELQQQGEISKAGVPGLENGVPTAALPRGGGGSTVASSVRGGVEGAQQQGDRMQQDARAALTNGTMNGAG